MSTKDNAKTCEEYVLSLLKQTQEELEKVKAHNKFLQETNEVILKAYNDRNTLIRNALQNSEVELSETGLTHVSVNGHYIDSFSKRDVEEKRNCQTQALAELINSIHEVKVERQGEEE